MRTVKHLCYRVETENAVAAGTKVHAVCGEEITPNDYTADAVACPNCTTRYPPASAFTFSFIESTLTPW